MMRVNIGGSQTISVTSASQRTFCIPSNTDRLTKYGRNVVLRSRIENGHSK